MDPHVTADTTFSELGLAPSVLAVLTRLKFTVPTPIQTKAIPIAVEGKDLVGIAQTGTGKTLAFAAPLLQRVAHTKKRGLILLPTRELALQVEETLQEIGRSFHVRTALLIGGGSMLRQKEALKRNPHVIVGTPGRIIDHLQQRTLHLR
ncbi:MAG: ATP-dependent RNA helicase DDX47/RRP3, partial [Parcubacteria group bacterium Gr01-1014_106]